MNAEEVTQLIASALYQVLQRGVTEPQRTFAELAEQEAERLVRTLQEIGADFNRKEVE